MASDAGRRDVTRRKVLAGSALAIGASASMAGGTTGALFRESGSATAGVGVASLEKAVYDYSSTRYDAQFQIAHRVTMAAGFDRLEIIVRNAGTGTVVETYSNRPKDGSVAFNSGSYNTTYEFQFDVYATGSPSTPVMSETITDVADGTDPAGNDPVGQPVDPVLDSWTIHDNSTFTGGIFFGDTTLDFRVSYQSSNTGGFSGFVRVQFENRFGGGPSATVTSSTVSSGSVTFPHNGQTVQGIQYYRFTIEIVRSNGIVVVADRRSEFAGSPFGGTSRSQSEVLDRLTSR